jgi:hypothetical protein
MFRAEANLVVTTEQRVIDAGTLVSIGPGPTQVPPDYAERWIKSRDMVPA